MERRPSAAGLNSGLFLMRWLNFARRGFRNLLIFALASAGAGASAQEMVQTFKDPSFGGNPFYSDHLLTIAGYHRPSPPTVVTSPEDLLASQLRAQLTSTLSTNILTTITTAKAGDSGNFTVGSQQISFTKTATETTVTFTNTKTGEVSTIVIPVVKTGTPPFGSLQSPETALVNSAQPLSPTLAAREGSGLEVNLGPPPL